MPWRAARRAATVVEPPITSIGPPGVAGRAARRTVWPVVLEGLAGPRLAQHADDLVDALAAAVEARAEHLELELAVADRERDDEPARAGQVVERGESSASRIGSHSGRDHRGDVIGIRLVAAATAPPTTSGDGM